MGDSTFWSVDQLAARNLLASLKMEATDANLELAAQHFARHRQGCIEWAAERVHSNIVRSLEGASTMYFERKSGEWTDGFRSAEHHVATLTPDNLLELAPQRTRTTGQVLRAMVRHARQPNQA